MNDKIVIKGAKEFQKEQGFIQWTDEYPNESTIIEDIRDKKGYVIKDGNKIAGYMCIDFSGEPAYENINGKWNTDLPYAVIHRMAISGKYREKGLSTFAFNLIEDFCLSKNVENIRVDTDFQNRRMHQQMTRLISSYQRQITYSNIQIKMQT